MVSILETLMDKTYFKQISQILKKFEEDLGIKGFDTEVSVNLTDDTVIYFNELKKTATLETVLNTVKLERIEEIATYICCNVDDGYLTARTRLNEVDILYIYSFNLTSNIQENIKEFQYQLEQTCESLHKLESFLHKGNRSSGKHFEESSIDIESLQKSIEEVFNNKSSEENKEDSEEENDDDKKD